MVNKIRDIVYRYECVTPFEEALFSINYRMMRWYFQSLNWLDYELDHINIMPSAKSIIFVGAGPFPYSVIKLHERFNLPVFGLERDYRYANIANRVVKKWGLDDQHVRIIHVSGEDYVYYDADTVLFLGYHCEPKEKVLQRAFLNGWKGDQMLIRSAYSMNDHRAVPLPTLNVLNKMGYSARQILNPHTREFYTNVFTR